MSLLNIRQEEAVVCVISNIHQEEAVVCVILNIHQEEAVVCVIIKHTAGRSGCVCHY